MEALDIAAKAIDLATKGYDVVLKCKAAPSESLQLRSDFGMKANEVMLSIDSLDTTQEIGKQHQIAINEILTDTINWLLCLFTKDARDKVAKYQEERSQPDDKSLPPRELFVRRVDELKYISEVISDSLHVSKKDDHNQLDVKGTSMGVLERLNWAAFGAKQKREKTKDALAACQERLAVVRKGLEEDLAKKTSIFTAIRGLGRTENPHRLSTTIGMRLREQGGGLQQHQTNVTAIEKMATHMLDDGEKRVLWCHGSVCSTKSTVIAFAGSDIEKQITQRNKSIPAGTPRQIFVVSHVQHLEDSNEQRDTTKGYTSLDSMEIPNNRAADEVAFFADIAFQLVTWTKNIVLSKKTLDLVQSSQADVVLSEDLLKAVIEDYLLYYPVFMIIDGVTRGHFVYHSVSKLLEAHKKLQVILVSRDIMPQRWATKYGAEPVEVAIQKELISFRLDGRVAKHPVLGPHTEKILAYVLGYCGSHFGLLERQLEKFRALDSHETIRRFLESWETGVCLELKNKLTAYLERPKGSQILSILAITALVGKFAISYVKFVSQYVHVNTIHGNTTQNTVPITRASVGDVNHEPSSSSQTESDEFFPPDLLRVFKEGEGEQVCLENELFAGPILHFVFSQDPTFFSLLLRFIFLNCKEETYYRELIHEIRGTFPELRLAIFQAFASNWRLRGLDSTNNGMCCVEGRLCSMSLSESRTTYVHR